MRTSPLRCSGVDHTVLPANNVTTPAFTRNLPGGATTEWTVTAPADEAYYSLIDPVRMKGWVGLVGWPTVDVWPTKWSSVQLAVRRKTESSPVKDQRSATVLRHQCQYLDNAVVNMKCCVLGLALTSWYVDIERRVWTFSPAREHVCHRPWHVVSYSQREGSTETLLGIDSKWKLYKQSCTAGAGFLFHKQVFWRICWSAVNVFWCLCFALIPPASVLLCLGICINVIDRPYCLNVT